MIWLNIAALALVGIAQLWLENRSQDKRRKGQWIVWTCLLLILAFLNWRDQIADAEIQAKNQRLLESNEALLQSNTSLNADYQSTQSQNAALLARADSLTQEITSLRLREQLAGVTRSVQSLRPRLVLAHVQCAREESGAFVTAIYFRSAPPGPLRNLLIKLRVSSPLVNASGRISGYEGAGAAVVFESGSSLIIDNDRLGLTFSTLELNPTNDVEILLQSQDSLVIKEATVRP